MFLNTPGCESEAWNPQTASKRPTLEWRRLNLAQQTLRFVPVLRRGFCVCACARACVCGAAKKCIFNQFCLLFFPSVNVATFFSSQTQTNKNTKAEKERRTESTQYLVLVEPPGAARLREKATGKKDKEAWDPQASVVTFDLEEGRSAVCPGATTAAGRTGTHRSAATWRKIKPLSRLHFSSQDPERNSLKLNI